MSTHWTEQKLPAHAAFEALEQASGYRISEYSSCVYMDDGQDSRWRCFERAWPVIQAAALSAFQQRLTSIEHQSAPERVSVLCEALEDARRAMFAVLNQEPRMKAVAKRVLNAEIDRIDRALLANHAKTGKTNP